MPVKSKSKILNSLQKFGTSLSNNKYFWILGLPIILFFASRNFKTTKELRAKDILFAKNTYSVLDNSLFTKEPFVFEGQEKVFLIGNEKIIWNSNSNSFSKSENLTNSNNQPNENDSNNSNNLNHLQAAAGFGLKSSVPKNQPVIRLPRRQSITVFTGTQIPGPGNQWISSEKTIYVNQTVTHAVKKSVAPGGESYDLTCANIAQVCEAGVYRVIYKTVVNGVEKYFVYSGQAQVIAGRWSGEYKQLEGFWANQHENKFLCEVHKLFKKNHMVYIEVSGTQFRGEPGSVCKHMLNHMERWAIENTKTCRLLKSVPAENIYNLNIKLNPNPPSWASLNAFLDNQYPHLENL